MTDILEATGLQKGGLYRHFESKDDLAVAAFDHAVRILEKRRALAQTGRTTALARLEACIDVVANSIYAPPLPGGCPILNTAIEADDTHAALRKRVVVAMRRWQERIVQIVDDGVASGELRPDAAAADVASVLISALEGAIMVTSLLRDPTQMERTAAHLREWIGTLRRRRTRRS